MNMFNKRCINILTILMMFMSCLNDKILWVHAKESTSSSIEFYQGIIEDFNIEHNTNYSLATKAQREKIGPESEVEFNNMFKMDKEEFKSYLLKIHNNADACSPNFQKTSLNPIRTSEGTKYQYWFYKGGTNDSYIFAVSNIIDVDGYTRYTTFTGLGYGIVNYPAQVPTSVNYANITNSSQTLQINYNYDKYLSSYVVQTAVFNASISFNISDSYIINSIVL